MDPFRHLMLTPDSARREDMATDLGIGLLATGGMAALTLRAIGERCGCSRQAVQQWFGGQEQLRHVVVTCFVRRWRRWVSVRVRFRGLAGLLPDSDDAVEWCRAWLAVVEHGSRDQRTAELVAMLADDERDIIAHALGAAASSDDVRLVHALVDGLRLGLTAPDGPAAVEGPAELLDRYLLARKQGGNGPAPDPPQVTSVT
jgi:AcrR family transcriptional regulator